MRNSNLLWSILPEALPETKAKLEALTLKGDAGRKEPAKAAAAGESGGSRSRAYELVNGVAVISLAGPMLKDAGWLAYYGFSDTRAVQRAVKAATADAAAKVIVLRIDSPGGSVDGLAELGDAVFEARSKKRVVAQVDGMAASAAYYVASQATEIRAGRTDLVGSIGTYLAVLDASRAYEQAGLEVVLIKTGEYKAAGLEGTAITPEQRADFQRIVDGYFEDFRGAVLRGRSMNAAGLARVSDGRLWLAAEAMGLGLIDAISTFDETMAREGAQAGRMEYSARQQAQRNTERARIKLTLMEREQYQRTALARLRK